MNAVGKWTVCFILLALSQHAIASQPVQCVPEGDYYSLQTPEGDPIGPPGLYSEDSCNKTVSHIRNNVTCAFWDGTGQWRPFNVSTYKFISTDYGYESQDECLQIASKSKNNAVCGWNGKFNQIYNSETGDIVGFADSGLSTESFCEDLVSSSSGGLVCNFQSSKQVFRAFRIADSSVYEEGVFKDSDECQAFVSLFKSPPGPSLSDKTQRQIFTPFKSNVNEGNFGFAYSACTDPSRNYHTVKTDQKGNLKSECMPDTLYSWGDYSKLQWFKDNLGLGTWTSTLPRPLYTTQSPAGTFGYGEIPLRIKLKANVKTVFSDERNLAYGQNISCDDLSAAAKKDTILVRYFVSGSDSGVDYILCSSGPIASWSYGTKEHYDEVVNEYWWVQTHNYKDYELYYKRNGVDQFIDSSIDGLDFSLTAFFYHMKEFYRLASENRAHIYYNQDIPHDEAEHFRTNHPSYFNPHVEKE